MQPYTLEYYTKKAKSMTDAELHFARLDIAKTIALRPELEPSHPYMQKLLNERDAIIKESHDRVNPIRRSK